MPGMPVTIPVAQGWQGCQGKCNATKGCKGWASYSRGGCDGPDIVCWLKAAYLPAPPVKDDCMVYGEQAGIHSDPSDMLVLLVTHAVGAVPAGGAARWRVTMAFDEIGSIDWFGEFCPPYWRRTLPVGNLSHPTAMLAAAYKQYDAVRTVRQLPAHFPPF